jgi:integrase
MSSSKGLSLVGELPPHLQDLTASAEFVSKMMNSEHVPKNMRKNFFSDWRSWESFINERGGMAAFLAHPDPARQLPTLQSYVKSLIDKGLKASTIKRLIYGLSTALKLLGVPDGTSTSLFRFYLNSTLKALAQPAKQATPMQWQMVNAIRDSVDPKGDIKLFRAALIIQIGYDTLCRGSELVAVKQADITFNDNGTGKLFVSRSKSDQAAIGAYRMLTKSSVLMIKQWIAMANAAGRYEYLLCPVSADSNAIRKLKKDSVEKPIGYSRLLADIKMFGDFTAHSTRVGAALDLLAHNQSTTHVQLAGGWKGSAMIAYYNRKAEVEDGAVAKVSTIIGR